MLVRIWSHRESYVLLERMQDGTTALERTQQILIKSNIHLPCDSPILPSGILLKRNGKSSQKTERAEQNIYSIIHKS